MKYNKQLFDQIEKEYNKLFDLTTFVYDQMIEKTEEENRFEVMSEFDMFIQGTLAKVIMDNDPKNPALFNILKKLSKFASFYQGINLDDWFKEKDKVLKNLNNKIVQVTHTVPKLVTIINDVDQKASTTEFAYQLLESMISLVMTIIPEAETFEDVEKDILNRYYSNIYQLIQK